MLLTAVGLAFLFPQQGADGGLLRSEISSKFTVAIVFLIQGLTIPTRHFIASATNVRLHLYVQAVIFIAAPLLMQLALAILGSWIPNELQAGFVLLSVVPTTIFTAIFMTGQSQGNAAAALFSSVASNLLGIFATPLWCVYLLSTNASALPAIHTLFAKIALLVLLPTLIGQAIRPFCRERIEKLKPLLKNASNWIVLFIVYAAFCNSVVNDIWTTTSRSTILLAFAWALVFLLAFSAFAWLTTPLGSASYADRIAAFFCGSQKTLAAGVPMASVIFAGSGLEIGMLILPLMCYHAFQLILAGALSPALASKGQTA